MTCPMANVHSNQYNKVCILYIVQFQVQSNVQCHGLSPAMPGMQMPQGAGSRPLLPVEVQCPLLNSRRCLGYTTQHCTLTSKATSIASTNTTSISAPSTSQWLVSRSLHGEQQERLATTLQGSRLPDCCGLVTLHWAAFSETGCQAESPESLLDVNLTLSNVKCQCDHHAICVTSILLEEFEEAQDQI